MKKLLYFLPMYFSRPGWILFRMLDHQIDNFNVRSLFSFDITRTIAIMHPAVDEGKFHNSQRVSGHYSHEAFEIVVVAKILIEKSHVRKYVASQNGGWRNREKPL